MIGDFDVFLISQRCDSQFELEILVNLGQIHKIDECKECESSV